MPMKRLLTIVLALCLCALMAAACSPASPHRATPSVAATPQATANPNPATPLNPTPKPTSTGTGELAIPAVGEQAPDFTLDSVWGDPITLSEYRGRKNVVLVFYRTGG
jgi:hypothetical protein